MLLILIYLGVIAVSFCGVEAYRRYAVRKDILDHPNERSSHIVPTPQGGGIVIALLWIIVLTFFSYTGRINTDEWLALVPTSLLIMVVGFIDDRVDVHLLLRAGVHLVCALWLLLVIGGLPVNYLINLPLYWKIIAFWAGVFAVVWSVNLFNFMDGLDGQAATEAIFIFMVGGYLVYQNGPAAKHFAELLWLLAAIVAGFLLLNRPKAKLFMGDAGSGLLGFLVAATGYLAARNYGVPIYYWVFLYGFFWFDASMTLMRRILHGDRWYHAHRLHAFHRLTASGFSHLQVLCVNISVNGIITLLVLWGYQHRDMKWYVGAVELAVLAGVYLWIEKRQPMYPKVLSSQK